MPVSLQMVAPISRHGILHISDFLQMSVHFSGLDQMLTDARWLLEE